MSYAYVTICLEERTYWCYTNLCIKIMKPVDKYVLSIIK